MAKLMAKAKAHDKLRAENADLQRRLAALKRQRPKSRKQRT